MQKKVIKKLVQASYVKNDSLDESEANRIASLLTRKELKAYIKALKTYEKQHSMLIESAFHLSDQERQTIKNNFAQKRVYFEENPELLFGVRITQNDLVFDMNLRKTLELLEQYVEENYD